MVHAGPSSPSSPLLGRKKSVELENGFSTNQLVRLTFLCCNMLKPLLFEVIAIFVIYTKAIHNTTEPAEKSGRLFTNPFGLLGHEPCSSSIDSRNVTGICYNEVECLLKYILCLFIENSSSDLFQPVFIF